MNINPRQIVGLAGIVVFGGLLLWTLIAPKPDPFRAPGTVPLTEALPAGPAAPSIPVPADPLTLGSQEARDDLYCSGLIYAAHRASGDFVTADASARRTHVVALAEAGMNKLVAAGAADATRTAAIADAHTAKAEADFAAGTPRITLDVCTARADAIPPPK